MDIEQIRQLLQQREPEDLKLDLKRELYGIFHPDSSIRDMQWGELIKDVLSLANGNIGTAGKPGNLVIGVADELNQHGIRELYDVGDVILTGQQVLDKINAVCRPHLPNIYCEILLLDGIRIFVITVPPTPHLHETIRALKTPKATYPENTVFIRRKEGVGVASTEERDAIKAEKQGSKASEALEHERLSFPSGLIHTHREGLAAIPRYARWADKSPDEAYIHSAGIHLPLFVSPYEDISGPSEELLDCIRSYHRLIILGEPGMGKTVAFERAMWEFSTSVSVVTPVFIPLVQYDGSLISSIMNAFNEGGVLNISKATDVEQLILGYQCVFLFDGLNEVPGSYRDKLYTELSSFLRTHPACPCVVTSRSQDSLWRRFHSREMIEDAFVVRRITEDQILDYLVAHLGERQGKELYDRLNEALRGLARVPLLLWLIKEAGVAGEELPGNRGGLFSRFVSRVLEREQKQPALTTTPAHQKTQILSRLAFHLQQEHRLACTRDEAIRVIHKSWEGIDGAAIIEESVRNGLLTGETRLYFMHQAMQEFFAALELGTLISSHLAHEKRGLERYSLPFNFKRQFRKWAMENWWSEVIVQLAGITDQPAFIAKQVLGSNPWLAYWCSIEGQPLDAEVQSLIEQKTVARLDSPNDDERFRVISELARMENPRTTSYLIIALGDTIARVQELASQTLVRLGEPSVNPLLDSLASATARARWAAIRVLGTIWHFPEVAKPPVPG